MLLLHHPKVPTTYDGLVFSQELVYPKRKDMFPTCPLLSHQHPLPGVSPNGCAVFCAEHPWRFLHHRHTLVWHVVDHRQARTKPPATSAPFSIERDLFASTRTSERRSDVLCVNPTYATAGVTRAGHATWRDQRCDQRPLCHVGLSEIRPIARPPRRRAGCLVPPSASPPETL